MKNTMGQNCDRNCLPGNPSISRTNLQENGEKWRKKKKEKNSQKSQFSTLLLQTQNHAINNTCNIHILQKLFISIAVTTFTLKLMPACCKASCQRNMMEPSYGKEWVINILHTQRPDKAVSQNTARRRLFVEGAIARG